MLNSVLMMACAVLLDRLLGEPRRFHPLIGFGRYAMWLEQHLNGASRMAGGQRIRGVLAWVLALAPWLALACLLLFQFQPVVQSFISILILYFALGMQSLSEHAGRIRLALKSGDLVLARLRVGEIVSRDTAAMQPQDVARAGVESVLENGNDAVFGALFWFAILGAPGALLYRLANTLDAMWGYHTPRFFYFGWAAARLDDVLNFIPARLTALTYALLGNTQRALHCWRQQAGAWASPNAGPVMASGAGSLCVQLGGAAHYHGECEARPLLGAGEPPVAADLARAVTLVQRGVGLWLAALLLLEVLHA